MIEDFTPLIKFLTSSAAPPAICSGLSFNYEAIAENAPINATFSWIRPIVSGIPNTARAGSGAFITEILINSTQEPVSVDYFVAISQDLCGSISSEKVSVVVNKSQAPLIAEYNVCQNGNVPIGEGLLTTEVIKIAFFDSTITEGNTYNRSSGNNSSTYTASGKLCYFTVIPFVCPSSASFTFETTDGSINDTFLSLCQNSFDPNNPVTDF